MSDQKQLCMVMKINVDCNACCRKLRRIILKMKAIETHLIEKERYRLIVFGRFKPSDIAIKIRKKMNRRVEILDIEEMDPEPPAAADQNPPEQIQPGPDPNQNSMFPSLDHDHGQQPTPMFPTLAANECRRSRPGFAVAPEPDMDERFWHYGYELAGDHIDYYSAYNYNYNYNYYQY